MTGGLKNQGSLGRRKCYVYEKGGEEYWGTHCIMHREKTLQDMTSRSILSSLSFCKCLSTKQDSLVYDSHTNIT